MGWMVHEVRGDFCWSEVIFLDIKVGSLKNIAIIQKEQKKNNEIW